MEPISGMISSAVRAPSTVAGVQAPPKVQREKADPITPARDEYVPEEEREPSGRYWPGKDEDGQPRVYFDDPERPAAPPDKQAPDGKAESCTGNTDQVDREIERLKQKREALEQRLNSETDAAKIGELEKELARIESELRQKDNDTYRRQHAVFHEF